MRSAAACASLLLLKTCFLVQAEQRPDVPDKPLLHPAATLISGPGLVSNAVLPVRYFYVQARDVAGNPLQLDLEGTKLFRILVRGIDKTCRTWVQSHLTTDGTLLVIIRLLQCCPTTVEVEITALDESGIRQQVADSPYKLPPLASLTEVAECPAPLANWRKTMSCPTTDAVIDASFKPFEPSIRNTTLQAKLDMADMLREAESRFAKHPLAYSVCFYRIQNNQIYRKCYGEYVGFNSFVDSTLFSILRKVELPDVDFLVNLGDYPLAHTTANPPLPILSWCGSNDTIDIVWPTYQLMESVLKSIRQSSESMDPLSLQRLSGESWSKRINQSIWRGRDSRPERLRLVELSRLHPEHINAALTNFFFYRDKIRSHGPPAEHMPFDEFFRFKYLINVDGTVAAYRLPFLLAGGSVVLKQESPYYEHFYPHLKPWEHYIPVKHDLSDLIEKIDWARNNDDAARLIAANAVRLVQQELGPERLLCFITNVLTRLSQISSVHPLSNENLGVEHVKQPANVYAGCKCLSTDSYAAGHEEL